MSTAEKPVEFLGDSLDRLREFPEGPMDDAGYQLELVQHGRQPQDWKPMPSIGKGVEEIRVKDASGQYRIVYYARLDDAVYVLHAFRKTSQRTAKADIELARKRYKSINRTGGGRR